MDFSTKASKRSRFDNDASPKHYINSLFMKWLLEWKDDAARKELKAQYTYAKVLLVFAPNSTR